MSSVIKCPKCSNEFPLQDAMSDEMKHEVELQKESFRLQMQEFKKMKEDEVRKAAETYRQQALQQEENFRKQMEAAVKQQQILTETTLRKTIAADYEHKLKMLQDSAAESDARLKVSREKEMEWLQKERRFREKEAELEITLQKKLLEEREKMEGRLKQEENEKLQLKDREYQMKMKELETQMETQKKMIDEMKRKAEQGSMQLQGEAQELLLEDLLRVTFPFDEVVEVGKGRRGADCMLRVNNKLGNEAGKIIYESKRTKDFSNEWIEKLKADMRSLGSDVAVIVTQTFPKDMERFGEKDGVYICSFQEVKGVTLLLRNALLKIYEVKKSGENKGDKMVMLYDYLTGSEFSGQWKAIREGFLQLRSSIQTERVAMEKLWKQREKQLEKILLNAAHVQGSVEGIAGTDQVDLNLLDEGLMLLE